MERLGINNRHYSLLIQNTINNAKISGNIRKTSWLYDRAVKGFFSFIDKNDTVKAQAFATQIDSMITILNNVYKDNWDFNLEPYYTGLHTRFKGFKMYVTIHFPHITIDNSESEQHDIKDLFVQFEIVDNGMTDINGIPVFSFMELSGTRSTLTYKEWFSGYIHSHLPSGNWSNFRECLYLPGFCLGEGTDIIIQENELMEEYTPEMFELYLMTIQSLVEWESLEGVPHIKVRDIQIGDTEDYPASANDSKLKDWYDLTRNKITDLSKIEFVLKNGKFRIKQNHLFERTIHDTLKDVTRTHKNLFVIKKAGVLYGYNQPKVFNTEQLKAKFTYKDELPYFYFREKKITFNLEPFQGELKSIEEYKVHPKFLNYVATKLEETIYYNAVRKSRITRKN